MKHLRSMRSQPSWLVAISVGGLLVAMMLAGGVGLLLNRHVDTVVHQAVTYDVELGSRGNDLRVAVLELRHYHRNLVFTGPTRGGMADFERAFRQLLERIEFLANIGLPPDFPIQPGDLREQAIRYYEEFRPSVSLWEIDNASFIAASDTGLVRIDELENAAQQIDMLGEQRSEQALANIESASRASEITMLLVLAGAVLIGAGLAWLVIQNAGETRRLYAQQRESAQQLADALQARNDFIADASHELRTPLTVLRGNAEVGLTLEGGGLHRELFEDIVAESTRMTRLVEDLLFLARSDSRSLPLDLVSVEPESLMLRVTETAEALARQRNVTLVSRIAGEGQVRVDPARVEQAVQILVDNATKYGVSDKPIELSSYTSDGEFHIRVTDHGTGISATDLPRIFDRFYRVDRARVRKQGGAGLGLSIASSIIEAHGGRIEAHSQINQGTTMTITLPLVAAPTPDSTGTVRGE